MKILFFYVLHTIMQASMRRGNKRFLNNLNNVEAVQKSILDSTLSRVDSIQKSDRTGGTLSWQEYRDQVNYTSYTDWQDLIKRQKQGKSKLINSPVMRYQPTSGSTSEVKTIPYTKLFLGELDNAISPWLSSMYQKYPGIKNGVHYWSLSWVPESKREGKFDDVNDDTQLLSPAKRLIAHLSQPVPSSVTNAKTMQDSMFATITFLAANCHLSMISVWSPTFALELLDQLSESKEYIAQVLETGQWTSPEQKKSLQSIKAPKNKLSAALLRSWDGSQSSEFYQSLWPKLALVSSWDTAMSEYWAQELCQRLSFADFEGKGLWATEGVVTIPFKNSHVLAYQSHYYEFRDAGDNKIHTAWQLRKGQKVIPIISAGNGFLRYEMNDLLEVKSFTGSVPNLEFKGRISGVDMVGEKMSPEIAEKILRKICSSKQQLRPTTLLAYQGNQPRKPQYIALLEDSTINEDCVDSRLSKQLDKELRQNFHYELACDLGQLSHAICIRSRTAKKLYLSICKERGMLEGDIKIEPLKHCLNSAALNAVLPGSPLPTDENKCA